MAVGVTTEELERSVSGNMILVTIQYNGRSNRFYMPDHTYLKYIIPKMVERGLNQHKLASGNNQNEHDVQILRQTR